MRDIAGHVSKQMLKHYSHIRMEAKRTALQSMVAKRGETRPAESNEEDPTLETGPVANSDEVSTKTTTVERVN
jgi:hypothetical protein